LTDLTLYWGFARYFTKVAKCLIWQTPCSDSTISYMQFPKMPRQDFHVALDNKTPIVGSADLTAPSQTTRTRFALTTIYE